MSDTYTLGKEVFLFSCSRYPPSPPTHGSDPLRSCSLVGHRVICLSGLARAWGSAQRSCCPQHQLGWQWSKRVRTGQTQGSTDVPVPCWRNPPSSLFSVGDITSRKLSGERLKCAKHSGCWEGNAPVKVLHPFLLCSLTALNWLAAFTERLAK